jgi:NADH:ubiquinone oxidoreductase subunit 4 (subunit M)
MQILAWLCLGNILYVGWVAMRQRNLNLLIGNSSVAHMGFIFLGIASLNLIGVTGAVVIMIAHGFLAALTFGLSGYIYRQTGTLEMDELGGLARKLPFIGTALLMAALAGCGLPGFANFVGEVTVFFGAWKAYPLVTSLAIWGALMIGALYMLRAMRNVLHGPMPEKWSGISDATSVWRKLPYALLLASLLVFGCFPRLLTEKITPDAEKIVSMTTVGINQAVSLNFLKSVSLARPHPGPLPQERENHSPSPSKSGDGDLQHGLRVNESGQMLPPLFGGEGRGEGGRINTSKASQSLLASAATEPK